MLAGIVLLVLAVLVPAHLRAVDPAVIARAGQGGSTLRAQAEEWLRLEKVGPARLLAQGATAAGLRIGPDLEQAVANVANANPATARWGESAPYLDALLGAGRERFTPGQPVLDSILPDPARAALLNALSGSRRTDVMAVLSNRQLPEPVVFPPVASPSGQALDAAILLTGLLLQTDQLPVSLRREIESLATAAARGSDSSPIESFYLNLNSMARRMDWSQISALFRNIEDVAALRQIARSSTHRPADLPVVFSAVVMANTGSKVADYLRKFPKEGVTHLALALKEGTGGVRELLRRGDPLHEGRVRTALSTWPGFSLLHGMMTGLAVWSPTMALLFKYLLWFDGMFCLVRGAWFLRSDAPSVSYALQVPGLNTLRQMTIAGLAVILIGTLGEPGLARSDRDVIPAAMWRFPKAGAILAQQTQEPQTIMNATTSTWLALGLFFVMQLVIYVLCLIKLREIKRHSLPSGLKVKLLDNEENLFDAGLYIGLGGTVLSLVLIAVKYIEPSLMVAYASTLFGILFVSLLKIFHVRPYRRLLLIDADRQKL